MNKSLQRNALQKRHKTTTKQLSLGYACVCMREQKLKQKLAAHWTCLHALALARALSLFYALRCSRALCSDRSLCVCAYASMDACMYTYMHARTHIHNLIRITWHLLVCLAIYAALSIWVKLYMWVYVCMLYVYIHIHACLRISAQISKLLLAARIVFNWHTYANTQVCMYVYICGIYMHAYRPQVVPFPSLLPHPTIPTRRRPNCRLRSCAVQAAFVLVSELYFF